MTPYHKMIACQHCGDVWMTTSDDGMYKAACTCGSASRKMQWKKTVEEAIRVWNKVALNW